VLRINNNIFDILLEFPRFISACRRSFIAIEKSVPALMLENIAYADEDINFIETHPKIIPERFAIV